MRVYYCMIEGPEISGREALVAVAASVQSAKDAAQEAELQRHEPPESTPTLDWRDDHGVWRADAPGDCEYFVMAQGCVVRP